MMEQIWARFHTRVKGKAAKVDGVWSVESPSATEWWKVMQFKTKKQPVDSTKTDQAWHSWMVKWRGKPVTLMIYEYGTAIITARDLEAFATACIRPEHTDRSGAAAEVTLMDIVARLRDQWSTAFQAEGVVWRMWANHIIRNLNRSTWENAIMQPPPPFVANLLHRSDSQLEQHIANVTRSAQMALDVVRGCLAGYQVLRRDWELFGKCLDLQVERLEARRESVEAFLLDIPPPDMQSVIDPLELLDNVNDDEHMENDE
ncbi:hypothetical protein P43SY_005136 [Pythium insidiosum]|uniref:Uncharacterized protein n=1 Tax=Pythium insidiosum TaxID=114742 RepID=A0AAD5LR35_PYTIN|nr:hypothetical protein P43SY_005136 [Pythium insidiosum]